MKDGIRSQLTETTRQRLLRALASGRDQVNPLYIFQPLDGSLLLAIAHGLIDPVDAARRELANRGLDADGQRVGFDEARRVWGVAR